MDNPMILSSANVDAHINKERVQNMLTIANQFHQANCFTKDVQNVYQAFVKIQAGAEMGMAPMESMNALYIVNGNVTMWGKALTQRLRQFGWAINYADVPNGCTATVKKGEEEYSYTATEEELRSLKSRAAGFALKDKLKWHAISRICRFYVPEVLGSVSYVKEEVDDLPEFSKKSTIEKTNLDLLPESTQPIQPKNESKAVTEESSAVKTNDEVVAMAEEVFAESPARPGKQKQVVLGPLEKKTGMKSFEEFAKEGENKKEKLTEELLDAMESNPEFKAEWIINYFSIESFDQLSESQLEYAIKWAKKGQKVKI